MRDFSTPDAVNNRQPGAGAAVDLHRVGHPSAKPRPRKSRVGKYRVDKR